MEINTRIAARNCDGPHVPSNLWEVMALLTTWKLGCLCFVMLMFCV